MSASRLSQQSNGVGLDRTAPLAGGVVPIRYPGEAKFKAVLDGQSDLSVPRILMFTATEPTDVFVNVVGSHGRGQTALFTITQAGRIAFDARHVIISAYNRSPRDNQFQASVGDGIQTTRNSWIAEWGQASPPALGFVRTPPMAEGLRAVSTLGAGSVATLSYLNAQGTATGLTPVTETATRPAVVAGSLGITVGGLAVGEIVTLSFDLGI